MKTSAILFNAPPQSGKDEAVKYLHGKYPEDTYPKMFKQKLFELVLSIYNIDEVTFFNLYDNSETKNVPTPLLLGESPRSAMIKVSEDVIKPNFGKRYFGNRTAENMKDGVINLFSDSGFVEEIDPIYERTEGRIVIIRIRRPGYTFERFNDSRRYITTYKDCKIVDLYNDSTLEDFFSNVDRYYQACFDYFYMEQDHLFLKRRITTV